MFVGVRRIPLLSIGDWLLDDLAPTGRVAVEVAPDDPRRGRLALISFVGALRAHATQDISDQSSFIDGRFIAIVQLCAQREAVELGRLLPGNDGFADAYVALSTRLLEQSLQPTLVVSPWSRPARVAALAAVRMSSGGASSERTNSVLSMLDDLAWALQIWNDLFTVPTDISADRRTYPIVAAAQAAGLSADGPLRPYDILGALVTTNALATILATATGHLEAARDAAAQVPLPTFGAFIDAVIRDTDERQEQLLSGTDLGRRPASITHPSEAPMTSLSKSLAMAEAFLLSDLTFRECWETHREGMLGAAEVVSRFPQALILEILCRRGQALTKNVDAWLSHAESNGFRYYDHPGSDPDSDTVGAALSLIRYSSRESGLSGPRRWILDCVASIVASRGQVPVWLTECGESGTRLPARALGEGCGTVAARLLIGLHGLGVEYATTFERGASALLDRIVRVGLGANVNYPPRYALALYLQLAEVSVHEQARAALTTELEKRSNTPASTAQEASLAILAARAAGRPDLIQPELIATILKQQGFDGSWIGEPFAMAPNRGWRVSPYSSTTLTTALCYDALTYGVS